MSYSMKIMIELEDSRFCNGCSLLTDQRPACGICNLGYDDKIITDAWYKPPDIFMNIMEHIKKFGSCVQLEEQREERKKYSWVKLRPKLCMEMEK